jgi:hypothetical protein
LPDNLEIRVALTELAVRNVDEKLDQHMADTKLAREELKEFINIRLQPLEDMGKFLSRWRILAVVLLVLGAAIGTAFDYITGIRTRLGI